jgi:hypothetical protein
MKKALEYAINKSEDPPKIKEYMEEYISMMGGDRRYKLKWRAICCNHKYTFSGIFEFAGQKYYFNKMLGKLELERI